ncbi:hypothetical protein GBF38_021840, partial [Nibea albiflora]
QIANSNPLPVPVGAPASAVVVESGPVVYDDVAAEEEEDEEEETCLSAMDLLGGNDGWTLKIENDVRQRLPPGPEPGMLRFVLHVVTCLK